MANAANVLRYYAGIGSRETPDSECMKLTNIAVELNLLGFTLRSGGAIGADSAFDAGADGNADIYLP